MDIAAGSPSPLPSGKPASSAGHIDWTPRDVLFGALWFVGIFVFGQVLIVPLALIYGDKSGQLYATAFIAGAAVEVAIAMVAANFTFKRYGGSWERLGFRPPTRQTFLWAAFAVVAAIAVSYAYGLVVEVAHLDFLKSDCAEQIPKGVRENRSLLALASLTVIAFAPICEETFFRGFVFTGLWRGWGVLAGIIASAVLFSGAHLLYKSFVPIMGVGLVFAFTYYKSRNILSSILAHTLFNSLSIAFIAAGSCDSTSNSIFSLATLRIPGLTI
jgi:membrane protease YdiL (CAAX protease family)